MPRRKTLQTNFSAGELAPELAMRHDTEQYKNGAKSLRNRRCLIGGGTKRRPGSWFEAELPGPFRTADFIVNQETQYVVAFGVGRMDAFARDTTTGELTAAGSITGTPWTAAIYPQMDWVQSGNTMFLTHQDMPTQVLTRTGAATWALANYAFFIGPSARLEQVYLKIADPAVTLQPSALTGSITLTISTAWFVAAHVGQYIRYFLKACLITAVAGDGLSCTATVIETLPDTQTLTVTSSANFAVGEVCAGETSGAKGIVSGIADGTHLTVVISEKLTPFAVEKIDGPNATTSISVVASAVTKAAVTDWDEQLFGPVYGYPGCVVIHRNRLLFGGHKKAGDYLIGSVINNLYDFNVGTGADGDAIIESIGDSGASRIVQLHSAEQLIAMTDKGPYYVPEQTANFIFSPSSMAFFRFGSTWPISSTARSQAFDGGVIMISGSLVIKARPTGDLRRSWDADEVSLLSSHIVKTPAEMTVTSNFSGGPERYAAMVNSDGTLAIMQLVEVQKIRNFTPWDTNGSYVSVAGIQGDLYCAVTRSVGGGARYFLERFDQNATLDCATQYATKALMDAGVPGRYGSTEVKVVTSRYNLGIYPPSLSSLPAGPYVVGLDYETRVETMIPVIDGPNGSEAGQFMRINEAMVYVVESARFAAQGLDLQAYQVTDDVSQPPPQLNGTQRFTFLGWERDPTLSITQGDPLPLTILSIRTEVSF